MPSNLRNCTQSTVFSRLRVLVFNPKFWYKIPVRVVHFALNFLLIPKFGYMGSSWATLICYFSMAVACYLLGQKFYRIPYAIIKGMAYILATIFIIYSVERIKIETQWIATSFHFSIIIAFLCIVYVLEKKQFQETSN